MSYNWSKEGRRVSIEEAREISKSNPDAEVFWRPEPDLLESEQYALVVGEEKTDVGK